MDEDTIWQSHAVEEPAEQPEPALAPPDNEHRVMACRRCQVPRVFARRATRHRLHFALALGTLGLWLPVWGLVIIFQRFRPWTCAVCTVNQREP